MKSLLTHQHFMDQGRCSVLFKKSSIHNTLMLCLLLPALIGCHKSSPTSELQEGTITYHIQYPQQILEQPVSNLLPDKMELFYTSSAIKFKLKGDLNLFSIEFLSRSQGDSCFTLFKVINRKMYYSLQEDEMWFLFDSGKHARIQVFPDSTKLISDYQCQLVKVLLTDANSSLSAYITRDIKLNNKLFRSPLGKVEGVPLEFDIYYKGEKYHFNAVNIEKNIGNESMFVPKDYENTSKAEISSILDSIIR